MGEMGTSIDKNYAFLSAYCYDEYAQSVNPTSVGFRYGTSAGDLSLSEEAGLSEDGKYFDATITGLSANTTYYYQAWAVASDGNTYTSDVYNFTTLSASQSSDPVDGTQPDWWEVPAAMSGTNLYVNTLFYGGERNYTIAYDKEDYTTYWVAYPLNSSHMGSLSRPGSWSFDPNLDESYQVDLCSHSYSSNYSRGHLIPNSSRNNIKGMQLQTFHVTNSVPQLQDKFNGSIWNALEQAVQDIAESEEIYVVTGTALQTVGGNESISYTTAKDDTKSVPVPNYFYKVVLKVETSGSTVTSASAIGFWFVHQNYSDSLYANYAVSVDQIEQLTGMDFFVNLPDSVESAAEANSSWSTFQNF